MANIILPAVPVLNEIDDSTKLLIEQAGEINRYPISELDIGGGDVTIDLSSSDSVDIDSHPIDADTLDGKPASEYVTKDYLILNDIDADTLGGIGADQYVTKDMLNNSSVKLNFSVVGGTEEPSNPTENMIWVNTEHDITKVVFRNDKPINPIEGMIYIHTGTRSLVSFDRVIINNIGIDEVNPTNVNQYVDGAWVDKAVKIYKGSEWVDLVNYLYYKGNEIQMYTGGWESLATGTTASGWLVAAPTLAKGNDSMTITMSTKDSNGVVATAKAIDLSGYSVLTVNMECSIKTETYGICSVLVYQEGNNPATQFAERVMLKDGDTIVNLPIDTLSGNYKVGFGIAINGSGADKISEYIIHSVYTQ